jgi:hypothetical protein
VCFFSRGWSEWEFSGNICAEESDEKILLFAVYQSNNLHRKKLFFDKERFIT